MQCDVASRLDILTACMGMHSMQWGLEFGVWTDSPCFSSSRFMAWVSRRMHTSCFFYDDPYQTRWSCTLITKFMCTLMSVDKLISKYFFCYYKNESFKVTGEWRQIATVDRHSAIKRITKPKHHSRTRTPHFCAHNCCSGAWQFGTLLCIRGHNTTQHYGGRVTATDKVGWSLVLVRTETHFK